MRVQRFSLNTSGRDFCIGDVHGAFHLVDRALERAHFDPKVDRLFFAGDLIDRGPQSERCVEFLSRPSVYAVRGNHEDMLLDLYAEGEPPEEALRFCAARNGFGWWMDTPIATRNAVLRAVKPLPYAIEIETRRGSVGIVHADVPDGMAWTDFCAALEAGDAKVKKTALWGRSRIQSESQTGVPGIDRVFVGHTPQWEGLRRYGNVYAIDTGAAYADDEQEGHLTVAEICCRTEALIAAPQLIEITDVRDHPTDSPSQPFGHYAKPGY